MIIVAGHLRIHPDARDRFLALSSSAVAAARAAPGCYDFAVSADLLEDDRVNICERWQDYAALRAFRGSGPGGDLDALIISASVDEFDAVIHAHP